MIVQKSVWLCYASVVSPHILVPYRSQDRFLPGHGVQDSAGGLPLCVLPCHAGCLGGLGTTPGENKVICGGSFLYHDALPLHRLSGLTHSGCSVGTFLIFTVAGYIAEYLGWEAVFYVTGASTLVWVGLWFYLAYDTPATHPRIDKEEREFIESSLHGALDRLDFSCILVLLPSTCQE